MYKMTVDHLRDRDPTHDHRNENVVILTAFWSLAASQVIKMTTSNAAKWRKFHQNDISVSVMIVKPHKPIFCIFEYCIKQRDVFRFLRKKSLHRDILISTIGCSIFVADTLVPAKHQAIGNQHADITLPQHSSYIYVADISHYTCPWVNARKT